MQGPRTLTSSPLQDAARIVTRALIAAGIGDDELADAAEDLDARSFAALKELFTVLQRSHASFRVVGGDADYSFDLRDVELAAERTDASRSEAQDDPFSGEFLAVLPEAHRFEFRAADGTVPRGRVAEELAADDRRNMNAEWANKACTAHVRVVTLTLTLRERAHTRHILQRLKPAN